MLITFFTSRTKKVSSLASFLVVVYGSAIAVFLEGCSKSGTKPDAKVGDKAANKPTKSPSASDSATKTAVATRTTFTTTTIPLRTLPMSVKEAAKYLNDLYDGFDERKKNTPLGVTISMAGQPNTFYGNIFCSKVPNPKFPKKYTSCFKGGADCRLSTSLYNHKMILNATTGVSLLGLGRQTGFVINDTRVENDWAKCAYIWDGSTQNKLNMGCGEGAPSETCNTPGTAFDNICPSTGKTCTAEDKEVQRNICKPYAIHSQGQHDIPATLMGNSQCTFPGPAFNHHGQSDYTPYTSNLRDMARARVERNSGKDNEGPNVEKWNEVVIDELLMLPEIWKDPALVIPAFVYTKSGMPLSKRNAQEMRDEFCKLNEVPSIPIVEIDDVTTKKGGWGRLFGIRSKQKPFKVPEGESLVETDATESAMASDGGHLADGLLTVPSRAAFVEIEEAQDRDAETSIFLSTLNSGMRKLRGSGATRIGTDAVEVETSQPY